MSPLKQIAAVAVLFVAAVAVWYALTDRLPLAPTGTQPSGEAGGEVEAPAVPVIVSPVRPMENRVSVRAVGTGQAAQTVSIFPRTAGEVVEVAFKPGEKVEAGALLMRLDDDEEKLAVRLAEVRHSDARSEGSRVGKECVSTCQYRGSAYP